MFRKNSVILFLGLFCSLPVSLLASDLVLQGVVSVPTGMSPRGIAIGDVLGNGVQDLVVANFGSPTFIGQSTPASLLEPRNHSLQIFSPSPNGLTLAYVIPTASSPRGISLYDLGNKGRKDILVTAYDSNMLQVFQLKDGRFVKSEEQPTLTMPVGVATGVTRSGGDIIVVVTDYGSHALSLFQVKDGKLSKRSDIEVNEGPTQVAIGDLNGDGVNEIAVVCLPANRIDILSQGAAQEVGGLPSFSVTSSILLSDGSGPADLRMADLNHDGRTDLVVANFSKSSLSVFYQKSDGSLAAQPLIATTGNRPNGLTVGDLFGDENKEIIVANRDSDSLDVFQSIEGSYRLAQTLNVSAGSDHSFGPVEVGIMDIQGDGRMDLVTSHMRSNTIKVLAQAQRWTPTPTPSGAVEQGRPFSEETTFCYPNPTYDGKTKISFTLDEPKSASIQIFNVRGEKVWSYILSASQTRIGKNEISWDGINQAGEALASGLYLYSITIGEKTITKKAAIIH